MLRSGVDTLRAMGTRVIRVGGSFTDGNGYFWKKWRGPPWARPSLSWTWGTSLVGGWGIFEALDMCDQAGIACVITTAAYSNGGGDEDPPCCSPDDMADLVEYVFGSNDTTWGRVRHADGHPAPFNMTYVELGNEQYNAKFVAQAAAMEARAKAVGAEGRLVYLFPSTNGSYYLNATDGPRAEALGMGARLTADIHVGSGGGIEAARAMVARHPNWTMGLANAETNGINHHMQRALEEAADLNDWFNESRLAPRLLFRTASFCMERSGHAPGLWDQGLSFFLPNMTWLQPPGHVHAVLASTWQPHNVLATLALADGFPTMPPEWNPNNKCPCAPLFYGDCLICEHGQSASAQASADGGALVARYVNALNRTVNLSIAIEGAPPALVVGTGSPAVLTCAATRLAADSLKAANPPGDPARVAPRAAGNVSLVRDTTGKGTKWTGSFNASAWSVTTLVCGSSK